MLFKHLYFVSKYPPSGRLVRTDGLGNRDTNGVGRGGVLASDDLAVNDDLLTPGLVGLRPLGTNSLEAVLEQEGHGLSEASLGLLLVGEAGNLAALNEGLAVNLDVGKYDGAVADGGDGLAGFVELLDQGDGVLVVDEVVHGAVAARVEEGGKFGAATDEFLERGRLLP